MRIGPGEAKTAGVHSARPCEVGGRRRSFACPPGALWGLRQQGQGPERARCAGGLLRQAHASREDTASEAITRLIEQLSKLRPGETSAVARDETPPPREPAQ